MIKVNLRGIHTATAKGKTYYYAWRGGGPRLRGELCQHVGRQVDPAHGHPTLAEWQRDAAGADGELERGPVPGQAGEEVHRPADHRRVEHVRAVVVVAPRDALAEVVRARRLPHGSRGVGR